MFVLSIADADHDPDVAAPLLVARADGRCINEVIALVLSHLATSGPDTARPSRRRGVLPLRSIPDSNDP